MCRCFDRYVWLMFVLRSYLIYEGINFHQWTLQDRLARPQWILQDRLARPLIVCINLAEGLLPVGLVLGFGLRLFRMHVMISRDPRKNEKGAKREILPRPTGRFPVGQPGPEPSLKSRFWPLNCRYEPLRAGEKSSIGGPLRWNRTVYTYYS